ncbi:MAG: hypothetical protein J6Q98_03080 [Bacteroidaceae bacterium]|nr:hypothetical protein [Bacteroidaceae bacterium]
MKNLLKVLLLAIVVVLVIVNIRSVLSPIDFKDERLRRDSVVIDRLVKIKDAEVHYYKAHGQYTDNFDTLLNFVKNEKIYIVNKAYELNDRQLEKVASIKKEKARMKPDAEVSLTIEEADNIVLSLLATAKEKGKWETIDELSAMNPNSGDLRNFLRDTIWFALMDTLYRDINFPIDSLPYIPFNEKGEKFALLTSSIQKASGDYTYLFEARADFVQYLQGINDQELANYILSIKKNVTQVRREPVLDEKGEPKFDENNEEVVNIIPCRRVGNVKEPNNNAGNWE